MGSPTNWRPYAACRQTSPLVFETDVLIEDARSICAACPVRAECLDEALRLRDIHGFRGGHTGEERARLLRGKALKREARPVPVTDVTSMLAAGWSCPAIAAALDVHVDSVRRVRRRLLKGQQEAA